MLTVKQRRKARRLLLGVSGGVAWTPAQLSPLIWLPEDGSTISEDVSHNLTGWQDGSGNARHVTSISTTAPTVVTIHGQKAVQFTAGSSTFAVAAFSAIARAGETAGLLWALLKTGTLGAASSQHNYLSIGTTGSLTTNGRIAIGNGAALYPHWNTQVAGTQHRSESQSAAADDTFYSLVAELDTTGNTCRLWVNETLVTDTLATGTEGTFVSDWGFDPDRFGLGCNARNSTPNNFASGIVFGGGWASGLPSAANLENLLEYLKDRRTFKSAA